MKRVITFSENDEEFIFIEEGSRIFEIDKVSLQFDVQKFYYAFFAVQMDIDGIEIVQQEDISPIGNRILSTVKELVESIKCKMKEVSLDEEIESNYPNDDGLPFN